MEPGNFSTHLDSKIRADFEEGAGTSAARSKTSLRIRYEAEVEVIRRQIGSLEKLRSDMGLSARKMCQLLMVDPSAWNRWTKRDGEDAPPHIYRALQWYALLNEKIPGLTNQYFLGGNTDQLEQRAEFFAKEEIRRKSREIQAEIEHKIEARLKSYIQDPDQDAKLNYLAKEKEKLEVRLEYYKAAADRNSKDQILQAANLEKKLRQERRKTNLLLGASLVLVVALGTLLFVR